MAIVCVFIALKGQPHEVIYNKEKMQKITYYSFLRHYRSTTRPCGSAGMHCSYFCLSSYFASFFLAVVDSKLQGCRESIPLPWKSVLAPLPVPLSLSMPNFNSCWKEDLYPSTLQEMKRNAEADWRHDTAHLQLSSHHISSFCCQGASGKCTRCKDLQCRCQTGECGKNVLV